MDIAQKLEILADAAKYDASCTSSGVTRAAKAGSLGSAGSAGCCHSFTPDGRCVSLLKVLQTNRCIYDCAYCVNRASNDVPRAVFTPRELAGLTIGFYRRNYIEGLFLSSGVAGSPDKTSELMLNTVRILREEHGFRGYIHVKAIPGTSPELLDELGFLADRMSVNLELPSSESLRLLAPQKSSESLIRPMRRIQAHIADDAETRALRRRGTTYLAAYSPKRKRRAFAPAGQSTQMIVGASPESDYQILNLSNTLYTQVNMKRVFFSAYIPVNSDSRLPATSHVPLDREHRLYQADWLMRFYGFSVDEVVDKEHPFLDLSVDPKANWALNHLDEFPIEVNRAPREALVRVPGIGVRGAQLICKARRTHRIGPEELKRLGIAYKRARYFITCNGKWAGTGVPFEPNALRAQLASPIDGGSHGRRADRAIAGQMSLAALDESFNVGGTRSPIGATATSQRRMPPHQGENAPKAMAAAGGIALGERCA